MHYIVFLIKGKQLDSFKTYVSSGGGNLSGFTQGMRFR